MAEASPSVTVEEGTPKAAKDRNCPFCGQAFTSSSLGRHLDLYIKERNPKKPDGIHDVDEIRRLRESVTRRQPKGSSRRRHTSTPAGTPSALSRKDNASDNESSNARSPSVQNGASGDKVPANIASLFPLGGVRWQDTGVMNEAMVNSPDEDSGAADEGAHFVADTRGFAPYRRAITSRAVSRQAAKTQMDSKQKLQDALDTARAAELALRELTNSWRAAKQQIEMESGPFDFDPLTMNFPALVLQCLHAQPTLFASTQLPAPSSWSTTPPGASQFETLKSFFKEEFRKWRVHCAVATTTLHEELTYPPAAQLQPIDRQQVVERAEKKADILEKEVDKHLEAAFVAWKDLPQERQSELWVLELARGIATKQTEIDKLREVQMGLRQEAINLKNQIEQLNRLQQPREFRIVPPAHIPVSDNVLFEMQDSAVSRGIKGVALRISDKNTDLSMMATTAIARWKNVIVSTRSASSRLSSQRTLQTPTAAGAAGARPGSFNSQTPDAPATEPATPSHDSPRQARRKRRSSVQAPGRPAAPRPPAPTVAMEVASSQPLPVPTTRTSSNAALDSRRGKKDKSIDEEDGANEDDTTTSAAQPAPEPSITTGAGSSVASRSDDYGENEADDDIEDEEMSDKDADAEMEDGDEFAHMHTPISRSLAPAAVAIVAPQPPQTMSQLNVPKTRATAQKGPQQVPRTPGSNANGFINSSRPMPNKNMAMGLTMPNLGGDAMFMD